VVATLDSTATTQQIEQLLAEAGNCRLPCWWGITPGTTPWPDAQRILMPIASKIEESDFGVPADTLIYTANFRSPVDEEDRLYLAQNYLVEKDIVERVSVRATNSGYYSIAEILNSYGSPSEVLIRTFRDQREGLRPFYIVFWYPKLGFVAIYASNGFVVDNGKTIEACWKYGPELTIWAPSDNFTFADLARPNISQIPPDDIEAYRPWSYATTEGLVDFIAAAHDMNHTPCLRTRVELWP
jgi:hypothetical protein